MTFQEELAARLSGTVVVVGVGNPTRGDDAAGAMIARRLRGARGVYVIEADEVPEAYVGEIARFDPTAVVFVDAVDLGRAPGDVALVEIADLAPYTATTHRAPLSLVMEVVRCTTGADVFLIAVQPSRADFGAATSRAVATTVELLAGLLSEVLRAPRTPTTTGPQTMAPEGVG